jgi:hypothetical protein
LDYWSVGVVESWSNENNGVMEYRNDEVMEDEKATTWSSKFGIFYTQHSNTPGLP